jgi:hypothetical protein
MSILSEGDSLTTESQKNAEELHLRIRRGYSEAP